MKSEAGGTRPNDPTDNSGYNIQDKSESIYAEAKAAVEALMTFLAHLHSGQQPLAVTYFDEAQQMGARFWVLLRVLGHQNRRTKMWYVLAEEKSSINYFTPPRRSCESSGPACVLISFRDNSTFSAAPRINPSICTTILCTRLRPERSQRSTGGHYQNW
jgi:hypothetical protein